jgi:hypothetical protein
LANQYKEEFPPLLPEGMHSRTLAEIRQLCVAQFPNSTERAAIMDGLEGMVALIAKHGISGEMWVDGSFTTQKLNPGDVDFVLFTPVAIYNAGSEEQQQFLDSMNDGPDSKREEYRAKYRCDTHWFSEYPSSSQLYALTLATRRLWDKEGFGRSVGTGEVKGIVTLMIAAAESSSAKGGA